MSQAPMAPSSLAQWFAAAGTIGAVIVALFKDLIVAYMRKPCLNATSGKGSPWTSRTPIEVSRNNAVLWKGEGYYIRAWIENSGRTRAEEVQVYASKLAKLGADNKFAEIQTFLPLNLKWANSPPGGAAILNGISPKMGAFCDVVAICDPQNPHMSRPSGTTAGTTIAELQMEVAPFTNSHLLAPGTYRLTLRIAAANVEPTEKVFEFKHTGTWLPNDDDMRRDCLSILLE